MISRQCNPVGRPYRSASYIAVPAVLMNALPEFNPSLYLGLLLGLTFPFNDGFGIPLYY